MLTVTVTELADGAGLLRVDTAGRAAPPIVFVDLDGTDWTAIDNAISALGAGRNTVVVGVATDALPEAAAPLLERLTCTVAPGGPDRMWAVGAVDDIDRIASTVATAPFAAVTLAGLLDLTSRLPVPEGLVAESLAYSMLLGGPEFTTWREQLPRRDVAPVAEPVLVGRDNDVLKITLNRPERHNAFGHAMRDDLLAALELAQLDDSIREIVVSGRGNTFCSGGDLDEFGTAPDVSAAHLVRLQQSVGLAVHRLGDRIRFVVHGACIGAGTELPAFAAHVDADETASFMLPELSMGLVPGAGGTVSITHRIGRWRTAYLALTGRAVGIDTALEWGLVDGRR